MRSSLPFDSQYAAALDFLHGRINYERRAIDVQSLRLVRMHSLLEALGNPHRAARIVHVAGTKGKGSTSLMIAAMLQAGGYKTGLYTSPHLLTIEERWQVNRQAASREELVALVDEIRPIVSQLDQDTHTSPTFFELTTALAFLHFAKQGVDWAVIEVGLGGRLDSTNVVEPAVSVITTIGLDHQAILGDTVELIAAEKAGIIKPQVPVVCGVTKPGPRDVIHAIAAQQQARVIQADVDFEARPLRCSTKDSLALTDGDEPRELPAAQDFEWGERFDYRDLAGRWHLDLQIAMVGQHQARNAGVALAAIETLQAAKVLDLPWPTRREGLLQAASPARLQWIAGQPAVLLDVAHNVDSMAALRGVVAERLTGRKLVLLFACSSDKDAAAMLEPWREDAATIVLTRFSTNPRQRSVDELLPHVSGGRAAVLVEERAEVALRLARREAGADGVVVICGSFFLAGELLPLL